jgi:predicted DNA repair protein MutK
LLDHHYRTCLVACLKQRINDNAAVKKRLFSFLELNLMASSLLVLLDDIATVLDDVAVLTKVAAKKTAGVLGDDLALNAQQVTGVKADRELPVVWAVCKGSFVNKLILVPGALLLSAVAPWAITPLLMAGGLFLCFEGFEKIAHKFLHSASEDAQAHAQLVQAMRDESVDVLALEKEKIRGAIRTDFILSIEIIVITLGTVAASPFMTRLTVLAGVAVLMTVGVYGLVAGIVKIDDLGLLLSQRSAATARAAGRARALLWLAPWLMKALVGAGDTGHVSGGWRHSGAWLARSGPQRLRPSVPRLAPLAPVSNNALLTLVVGLVAGAVGAGSVVSLWCIVIRASFS